MSKRNKKDTITLKIFADDQGQMFDKSLEQELEEQRTEQVECLGVTFPNDEQRRKHFLGILREKLKDPEFRKIEGFPIGSDEDILALSAVLHRLPEPVHSGFHQALRQALRLDQAI